MKKIIILLFVFISICNISFCSDITDIENHWARESILRLIYANAVNGYGDNTFKPENNITIAEFLKILVAYTDYKKVLVGERWPDWYINTAKYYGFITENELKKYDNFITRYEASKIIAQFINVEDVMTLEKAFIDSDDITVRKLATLGVINGYEDGTFKGNLFISRAEAATIICKAMQVRRSLVANKRYSLENAEKLTNIGREPSYKSDYSNRYEIKNNKIFFYDNGRYAKLDGFTIEEKNVDNKTIINLIKNLIQEDAYVGVSYVPDDLTYNQIIVDYGTREGYVYNNSFNFSFIFYPDRQFELRRSSLNDKLSEKCFMKISVGKMWKDSYDMHNGQYAHELNNAKLMKALKAIFEEKVANEIYNYIQIWLPILFKQEPGEKTTDVKKIGKYDVNLYSTGNCRVELYISR